MTLEDDVIGIGYYLNFFAKLTTDPRVRYLNSLNVGSVVGETKTRSTSDPYTLVIPRELME